MGTTEKLVEAAMELIAKHGYAATTTREIASSAGVSEVTLFRHFGSKAGLLQAIGERFATANAVSHLPTEPVDDLYEVLHRIARFEVDAALLHGHLALRLAIDATVVPEVAAALGSLLGPSANLSRLVAFFELHQKAALVRTDVDAAVIAEWFTMTTSTVVMTRQLLGTKTVAPDDVRRDVERLVDLFFDAITATPSSQQIADKDTVK